MDLRFCVLSVELGPEGSRITIQATGTGSPSLNVTGDVAAACVS